MFSSEHLPTYLISFLIICFVVGKLSGCKIPLVSRLIDKTSDFCIISITHVFVTVYSPTLIPYVFLDKKFDGGWNSVNIIVIQKRLK
jgi:hypothetical protein